MTENAAAVVHVVSSKGLKPDFVSSAISKQPTLLTTPLATLKAVDTWCSSELGWCGEEIVSILLRFSSLFCFNPFLGLTPRLEWFMYTGFSRAQVSKLLLRSTNMFTCTHKCKKAQLLALQNIGLSELRVAGNISKEPDLLARDFAGGVTLDQVYFLTHVVGKQVTEVLVALPGISQAVPV